MYIPENYEIYDKNLRLKIYTFGLLLGSLVYLCEEHSEFDDFDEICEALEQIRNATWGIEEAARNAKRRPHTFLKQGGPSIQKRAMFRWNMRKKHGASHSFFVDPDKRPLIGDDRSEPHF